MSCEVAPELCVIVPTYGRPDAIAALLERLAAQTLAPERFEVIAVDDGTPEPIAIDPGAHRFAFRLLRQENAGPGAARNRALEHSRAPLLLILNDDAVPAPDLLEKHLEIHATAPERVAVLGSFHFSEEALRSPFVRLLEGSDLLFAFPSLRHGELHDWTFFWTCNLSLPAAALREVGGFDESFRRALKEDVELGYRLEQRGWRVLYREDARAWHDHAITPRAWLARMVQLGVESHRMWEKHRDGRILNMGPGVTLEMQLQGLQLQWELYRGACGRVMSAVERLEQEYRDRELPAAAIAQARRLMNGIGIAPYARGVLTAANGVDPEERIAAAPAEDEMVSLILVSHDGLEKTRRCLEALRASRESSPPFEILFVDNGSSDGSAEYLAAQEDVRLIRNRENRGAPHARNQAIPQARGRWLAFLDNDAIVSPEWLERLLHHARLDPRVGCVCPMSDRAAHGQQIPYDGGDDLAAIRAFADQRAREHHRRGVYKQLFTSFCVLVHHDVVDRIGGFDERFSPWGFEDDDFSLRAHLAGFRSRLALDVFVRHESYGGEKGARHSALLTENWRRFAQKWSKGPVPPYGDYGFLEQVLAQRWRDDELRVALPGESGRAAGASPAERGRGVPAVPR